MLEWQQHKRQRGPDITLRFAVVLAAALTGLAAPAHAQSPCPEGRTFSGECVKPDLARTMRKSAIIYSLPKFSHTAPPLLPSEDGEYYVPPDYNEMHQLFGVGAASVDCAVVFVRGHAVACR